MVLDFNTLPTALQRALEAEAPPQLGELLTRLQAAGFDSYLVGGAVRDLILARLPISDWDIATKAKPDEVAKLFDRSTLLHASHGTVQVRIASSEFEVTTFREDGPYTDGRRPDFVRFSDTIEADLSRRDFTVNAMAFDPTSARLVDPHGGIDDAQRRVIRAVGDAETRFLEDGLRLLRAARFAAVLEFEIDPETKHAMSATADRLAPISGERKRDELVKLLGAKRPSVGFRALADTGLLIHVLPELDACRGVDQHPEYHAFDVFEHTMHAVDHAPRENLLLRLAALMHDVGKVPTRAKRHGRITFYSHEQASADSVRERFAALKFGRRDTRYVEHLVRQHMFHYEPSWSNAAVRRFVQRVTPEAMDDLFALRVADTLAKREGEPPPDAELHSFRLRLAEVIQSDTAFRVQDLAIGGRDLMNELNMPPGRDLGVMLNDLLAFVIDRGGSNTRGALLAEACRLRGRA